MRAPRITKFAASSGVGPMIVATILHHADQKIVSTPISPTVENVKLTAF